MKTQTKILKIPNQNLILLIYIIINIITLLKNLSELYFVMFVKNNITPITLIL